MCANLAAECQKPQRKPFDSLPHYHVIVAYFDKDDGWKKINSFWIITPKARKRD